MPIKQNLNRKWLTDFCESTRIFVSIVMIQIGVIIYAFSFLSFNFEFLRKLSILTLMAQLVGIIVLILLCKLRHGFNRFTVVPGVLFLIGLMVVITTLLAQTIGFLDLQLTFNMFESQMEVNYLNLKLSVSSIIICLALVRYFYVQDQFNQQIEKLSNARLNALQARIKPHFLFNSLNSIASLISIDAERAEVAIADFASLMRRTFTYKDKLISVDEELLWVKQYLAIEKLRLDSRLSFTINCDEALITKKIPVLCLQPLVENAIIHGIQPLEEGGGLSINIYTQNRRLFLKVTNPFIKTNKSNSNGMALANIEERLQLQYAAKAFLKVESNAGVYTAIIGIPL